MSFVVKAPTFAHPMPGGLLSTSGATFPAFQMPHQIPVAHKGWFKSSTKHAARMNKIHTSMDYLNLDFQKVNQNRTSHEGMLTPSGKTKGILARCGFFLTYPLWLPWEHRNWHQYRKINSIKKAFQTGKVDPNHPYAVTILKIRKLERGNAQTVGQERFSQAAQLITACKQGLNYAQGKEFVIPFPVIKKHLNEVTIKPDEVLLVRTNNIIDAETLLSQSQQHYFPEGFQHSATLSPPAQPFNQAFSPGIGIPQPFNSPFPGQLV